jgi:hypothetical protein
VSVRAISSNVRSIDRFGTLGVTAVAGRSKNRDRCRSGSEVASLILSYRLRVPLYSKSHIGANKARTPAAFQQSYVSALANNGAIGSVLQPFNLYVNAQIKI